MNHSRVYFPQVTGSQDAARAVRQAVVSAARAVHRVVGELRRGVPVILDGAERWALLAAETATTEGIVELAAFGTAEAFILLSPTRSKTVQGMHLAEESAAVGLHMTLEGLTVERLLAVADPGMDLPPGPWIKAPIASPDQADAAMRLVKLARLLPAVLAVRLQPHLAGSALLAVQVPDVLRFAQDAAFGLVQATEAAVPMAEAPDARLVAFRPPDGGLEHLAILIGRPETADAPLVRVHSECFTGDLLGSLRCDCGPQLHQAIRRMHAEGAGVLLYMAHEGRGIGLVNKLRAYRLQDAGLDTLDANRALGFEADERSFVAAGMMLHALGVTSIRLLTNNPDKIAALEACGIEVAGRVSHAIAANGVNDTYLETKSRRFGHLLG